MYDRSLSSWREDQSRKFSRVKGLSTHEPAAKFSATTSLRDERLILASMCVLDSCWQNLLPHTYQILSVMCPTRLNWNMCAGVTATAITTKNQPKSNPRISVMQRLISIHFRGLCGVWFGVISNQQSRLFIVRFCKTQKKQKKPLHVHTHLHFTLCAYHIFKEDSHTSTHKYSPLTQVKNCWHL